MTQKTMRNLSVAGAILLAAANSGLQASPENIPSIAVLGDAEPKPQAHFPNFEFVSPWNEEKLGVKLQF